MWALISCKCKLQTCRQPIKKQKMWKSSRHAKREEKINQKINAQLKHKRKRGEDFLKTQHHRK